MLVVHIHIDGLKPNCSCSKHVLNISLSTGNQGIKLFSNAWGYYFTILVLGNIARGKPAFQKDMGWGGLPARGVDGNRNGQWGGASCTHTNIHSQAWWAVDLGKEMSVTRVSISNRADCCCKLLLHRDSLTISMAAYLLYPEDIYMYLK